MSVSARPGLGPEASLLLGLAVGDALGVPVEFMERGAFLVTGMRGHGTHGQPPGTWSDDASLALCMADSLSRGFDIADMAWNFVAWRREGRFAARGEVFDIGGATAKAIARLAAGVPPEESGERDEASNGNGSLMRIAPLVFHSAGRPPEERLALAGAASSITHAHPWSVAACHVLVEYLAKLLDGKEKVAAYDELRSELGKADIPGMEKLARVLKGDVRDVPESGIKSGGFVADTLEAALWCFLLSKSYEEAVLRAVNLGDDSDTTAAVAGAMAGLFYGAEGIPREWIDALAGLDVILRVAQGLAGRPGFSGAS
ncbi:MAG: ADP-ribosylglycohydrolase family protein [Treponema sp.]|nr:ADP-ribosylglycohydrolase family protein [Treponema sp.]